jgi:hypothetical protein
MRDGCQLVRDVSVPLMHDTSSRVIALEVDRDNEICGARRYLEDFTRYAETVLNLDHCEIIANHIFSCVGGENRGRIAVCNAGNVAHVCNNDSRPSEYLFTASNLYRL